MQIQRLARPLLATVELLHQLLDTLRSPRKSGHTSGNEPIGEHVKVRFPLEGEGPAGESMWAERVEVDCYRLLNNGGFVDVAEGDIVRANAEFEVTEVIDRARLTWVLAFDLEPSGEERRAISEASRQSGRGEDAPSGSSASSPLLSKGWTIPSRSAETCLVLESAWAVKAMTA